MLEVLVLCEGQTEREFCRSILKEHLAPQGINLAGLLPGKGGGVKPWPAYRREIIRFARERADRYVGVLVDYYGMPTSWPGRDEAAATVPIESRGVHVEDCLRNDLQAELGARFVPCVQLHEFESLLFVDPEATARSIAAGSRTLSAEYGAEELATIKESFSGNVERIDDSPATAPSKRITAIFAGYDKVAWGVLAAKAAGIETLRNGCPWFDRWLTRLESIASS